MASDHTRRRDFEDSAIFMSFARRLIVEACLFDAGAHLPGQRLRAGDAFSTRTTSPATTPNPSCESTNHHQSMCAASAGLIQPSSSQKSRPQEGCDQTASTMGCRGSIGSIAP